MKKSLLLLTALACTELARGERAGNPPPFGLPVDPDEYRVSAAYDLEPEDGANADFTGWTSDEAATSTGRAYDTHNGIDFGMSTGTALRAIYGGSVNASRESVPNDDHSDLGNYLQLDHTAAGRDWRSYYWHLEQNGVVTGGTGASVTKGNIVAYSDNTGNSTGPHCHYGISTIPGHSNCPFYKAWWEADEFYWGINRVCLVYVAVDQGPINVYQGDAETYNVITTLPTGTRLVATARNGNFWRVFLPVPPSQGLESRDAQGNLSPYYSEQGAWTDSPSKTTVADDYYSANRVLLSGLGSRVVEFEDATELTQKAAITQQMNMKGNYDLYVSWPSDANAAHVTYHITDSDGRHDVAVDQKGGDFVDGGDGTKENPYRIGSNPYVVTHTTVGAPSEWDEYTPCGPGKSELGPENVYEFTLSQAGAVTVTVDTPDYPAKDIDVHLLSDLRSDACLYRDNGTFTTGTLAAGTYYVVADTFGTDNTKAGEYTLTVSFSNAEPAPNQWYFLGTYWLDKYQDPLTIEVDSSTVTGKFHADQPGRVYADAFKLTSKLYRRSGWIRYDQSRRIDTNSEPTGCVVVNSDVTTGDDSYNIHNYLSVKVYDKPEFTATSKIVGKIVTGQRFICDGRAGADRDWYRIVLTNGTAQSYGWVAGEHLIGYHTADLPTITESEPVKSTWLVR